MTTDETGDSGDTGTKRPLGDPLADATMTAGAPALAGIVESARRLGVELNEAEAAEWVAALAVESAGGDVVVDVDSGIFGHRASMLDFTPGDLARFRAIGASRSRATSRSSPACRRGPSCYRRCRTRVRQP